MLAQSMSFLALPSLFFVLLLYKWAADELRMKLIDLFLIRCYPSSSTSVLVSNSSRFEGFLGKSFSGIKVHFSTCKKTVKALSGL